jgi:glycosyltransferase involved in cell wall biosynthesis
MKVTLFIPTLNEVEGMKIFMPQVKREWFDQILVVDANSPDGTAEYARSCGCDVVLQKKPGLRNAYIEGWPQIKGDLVVTLSPDGNCRAEDIPGLISKMKEGYDMVVASRYFRGIKSEDDDAITAFGNWMFTTLINVLHGGHYTDAMGIFRGYRTHLFYELDLDKEETYTPEKYYGTIMGVEPILSVRAAKAKMKITEVLGFEPKRLRGQRKLQVMRWGAAYLTQVLREVFYWKK